MNWDSALERAKKGEFSDEVKEAATAALERMVEYGWHDLKFDPEDLPETDRPCVVEFHGSDYIHAEKGETIEQAVERIRKEAHITIAHWSDEDAMWDDEWGFPMMVQPVYWRPVDLSPKGKHDPVLGRENNA